MYRTDDSVDENRRLASVPLSRDEDLAHVGGSVALAAKRLFDVLGALVFFAIFFPLFLAVALAVKRSSPGPIFYVQDRVGRGGRAFKFYKFRSMCVDSEGVLTAFLNSDPEARETWDKYQKIENDPRITRFGRFIRRTSLDELPQFWNVLRGDMSLVGPRPCMVQQQVMYGRSWTTYCSVRPGLTGLWQVSGRNLLTYRQRVELDVKYVRSWSLILDIEILFKTLKVVLAGSGSH